MKRDFYKYYVVTEILTKDFFCSVIYHLSSGLDKKLQKLKFGVRIQSKMRKRINIGLSNNKSLQVHVQL